VRNACSARSADPSGTSSRSRGRVKVGEALPETAARPADAGLNSPERHAGSRADLLIAEAGPHQQQQRVTLVHRKLRHGRGQPLLDAAGRHRVLDPVGERRCHRIGAGSSEQPELPDFVPALAVHQPRRDPVQPRQAVLALVLVACPLPERHQERLRHHILSAFPADAPGDIPTDGGTMPPDEDGEPFRI
jgi:hypothetical protein